MICDASAARVRYFSAHLQLQHPSQHVDLHCFIPSWSTAKLLDDVAGCKTCAPSPTLKVFILKAEVPRILVLDPRIREEGRPVMQTGHTKGHLEPAAATAVLGRHKSGVNEQRHV